MKKITLIAVVLIMISAFNSFSQTNNKEVNKALEDAKKKAQKELDKYTNKPKPLTNDEVIRGLREALSVGTKNSTAATSKVDGFYKNPLVFIPFPPEAEKVKSIVVNLGMQKQVDEFVMTLNRAAEEASKEAAPIFLEAIKGMSISDGFKILKGADNAATTYLQDKTTASLTEKFNPVIKKAIDKVQVTKYWNPVITTYNKVPGVQKQNPNLEKYITAKAMEGLFKLIAGEEKKIRKDPLAQVSALLKKVFGKK
jgi:enolase